MHTGDRGSGDGRRRSNVSIIQEALKKAQGEYVEKKIPPAANFEEVVLPKTKNLSRERIKRPAQTSSAAKHSKLSVLVGVLTILFLIYGIKLSLQYSRPDGKKDITAPAISVPETKAATPSAVKASEPIKAPKIEPVNLMPSRPPTFVLNGIMYVESRPQAIINGYVLEEGDKINGATVLVIEKDCVLLDINNANMKLEMGR